MNRPLIAGLLFLSLAASNETIAAGPCDAALELSTYNSFSSDHVDYRLAISVTESEWNQIKQDEGANALIYGVLVGESYSDYQARAHTKASSYSESLQTDQVQNILWTGLDANSVTAYSKCLDAEVFSKDGLHMAVKSATAAEIAIVVSWRPVVNDPTEIAPTWSWRGNRSALPTRLHQGTTPVILPRPNASSILAVSYKGTQDTVVLEPAGALPVVQVLPWYLQKKVELPLRTRVHVSQVGNECMTVDYAGLVDESIKMDCPNRDPNGWTWGSPIAHIEEFDIAFDQGAAKALGMPSSFSPDDLSFTYYCEYQGDTPWQPHWVKAGETCGNENGLSEPRLIAFEMKLTGTLAKDFELIYWCSLELPFAGRQVMGPFEAGANCGVGGRGYINGLRIQITSRTDKISY